MEEHGRVCSKCDIWKAAAQYKKDRTKKDGLNSSCKPCNPFNPAKVDRQKQAISTRRRKDKNPEHFKRIKLESNRKNKERLNAREREWRKNTIEIRREVDRLWRLNNPGKIALYARAYRAKRRANDDVYGARKTPFIYIAKLLLLQKYKCIVCKSSLKKKYQVDHIVPVSKGGSSKESNLQLLCGPCNCSKKDKDPIVFMQSRGMLL